MASELRVDTLKDSSGNNSVGMSYVSNGSARHWLYAQHRTATVEVKDSFNVSSWVDDAAGRSTTNLTNAMSNTNYNILVSSAYDSTSGSGYTGCDEGFPSSSSAIKHDMFDYGGTFYDCDYVYDNTYGDLA
jgi:hypothetical protein